MNDKKSSSILMINAFFLLLENKKKKKKREKNLFSPHSSFAFAQRGSNRIYRNEKKKREMDACRALVAAEMR
jgi:hypothetical protein